jgi:hypothetical protein
MQDRSWIGVIAYWQSNLRLKQLNLQPTMVYEVRICGLTMKQGRIF